MKLLCSARVVTGSHLIHSRCWNLNHFVDESSALSLCTTFTLEFHPRYGAGICWKQRWIYIQERTCKITEKSRWLWIQWLKVFPYNFIFAQFSHQTKITKPHWLCAGAVKLPCIPCNVDFVDPVRMTSGSTQSCLQTCDRISRHNLCALGPWLDWDFQICSLPFENV